MEELRSTEVLDREILEDARKKAHKILKTADDTLAAQKREWEKKTLTALESARKHYSERTDITTKELLARLPLDKKRARSEAAESLLNKAMDDFLTGLKRETLLAVLVRELSRRLGDPAVAESLKGGAASGVKVRFSGMDISEARDVIKKAAGKDLSADWDIKEGAAIAGIAGRADDKNTADAHQFPSIVIDTQPVKITASVENAAAELLKEKRAELAGALLGEEVLND